VKKEKEEEEEGARFREIIRLPSCSCALYRKNSSSAAKDGGSYVANGGGERAAGDGEPTHRPFRNVL